MGHPVESLESTAPNEVVTVRRVLFECVQARCAELGLREGDRVRVGGGRHSTRVLRRMDRRVLRCPAELARFVEVIRG